MAVGFGNVAIADGIPKIQFDQTMYDFGKISEGESIRGSFKFKNAGDGVLKMGQLSTSCGCTIAALKKDSLAPGETAEVAFTMTLRGLKGALRKTIRMPSNDPQNPVSVLTIKGEYTPLYEISPLTLRADVPRGGTKGDLSAKVIRTDGKPVQIQRIETSNSSIIARVHPGDDATGTTARIQVEVRGGDTPRRFNEFISVYAGASTDTPVARIFVSGRVQSELTVSPEKLFWSITDPAKAITALPEVLVTRRLMIRSSSGKGFELTNPHSTIKGVNVELNPLENGKAYEVVARLVNVPTQSLNGSISFETSVASEPEIQIPVSIRVVQRNATTGPFPRILVARSVGYRSAVGAPQPLRPRHRPPIRTDEAVHGTRVDPFGHRDRLGFGRERDLSTRHSAENAGGEVGGGG